MLKLITLLLLTAVLIGGCAHIEKTDYVKTEAPYNITAIRNYLPESVRPIAAYTIYENSKWICNYKTSAGDFICCMTEFSNMSPWKYCLLVDQAGNGFGFAELGTGDILKWPEGKQLLFNINKKLN